MSEDATVPEPKKKPFAGLFEEPPDIDIDDGEPVQPVFEALPPMAKATPSPLPTPSNNPTRGALRGQPLPHSTEAEESVLSCIFIDPEAIGTALDHGLTPRHFYHAANEIIFDCALSLHARNLAPDLALIAEELKTTGQLADIGGYPYLVQVSAKQPTTAQLPYFVFRLLSLSRLREIAKAAARVQERISDNEDAEDIIADHAERVEELRDATSATNLLKGKEYDPAQKHPKPPSVFSAAKTTICTPGNITTFYAQAKVGKTAAISAMFAATFAPPGHAYDCLGFEGTNERQGAVIHIETEQSAYDWQNMIATACRRARIESPPPWFHSYHLTGCSAQECRSVIAPALKLHQRQHGHIHSLFIDGVGDLVIDPNDPKECFPLITELHKAAISYACPVILVLHMNAGSENEKGRGHLGSQLERKSESNITMAKNGEVSSYWATKQRGKMIAKDGAPAFKWSEEAQMHVSCDGPESSGSAVKKGRPQKYSIEEFFQFFPKHGDKPIPVAQLYRLVRTISTIPQSSFKDMLKRAQSDGLIHQVNDPAKGAMFSL